MQVSFAFNPPKADRASAVGSVYTVPSHASFLDTLAQAMCDGRLMGLERPPTQIELATATILLPTRRATRGLQDAFLNAVKGNASLLPRIRPIAQGDEDASLFHNAMGNEVADSSPLPPTLDPLARQLVLTQLVLRWSAAMEATRADDESELEPVLGVGAKTPAQAAALARELAKLLDLAQSHDVALSGLEQLVGDAFSVHWQRTLRFLEIVTDWWPQHLASVGALSPMDRRNRLIRDTAANLTLYPPSGPVIVAGVTGSIPATAELMSAVLALPNGAIVLPGLDCDLDIPSWDTISNAGISGVGDHPQWGLKRLLDAIGIARESVKLLTPNGQPAPTIPTMRAAIISQTMRPSATTGAWHRYAQTADRSACRQALDGLTVLDAASAHEEAETIALIMREVAESRERTAALVTPDRVLARRVASRLEAWGIRVDDAAGRMFSQTVPGTLLDLIVENLSTQFCPVSLLALLTHPLVRLGRDVAHIRRAARVIELAAFRGPYLGQGLGGVRAALEAAESGCGVEGEPSLQRRPRAVRALSIGDWRNAYALIDALGDAIEPLLALHRQRSPHSLAVWAQAHSKVAEALSDVATTESLDAEGTGEAIPLVWQAEAGTAAQAFFEALMQPDLIAPEIKAKDYPDFYRALVAGENVYAGVPPHPRLSIWGPYEARLQRCDVTILGGLNEGTWPQAADPGPWLNRPMRAVLGLPSPEVTIGQAAHDFTQLIAGETVYLTRAEKVDRVPTVPSRWLMRLEALAASLGLKEHLRAHKGRPDFQALARLRDQPGVYRPVARPAPTPPFAMRPRALSVSAIEKWIANPYAIFAAHILKLEALPPLGSEPDNAIRGAIIHDALARFTAAYPAHLPTDIAGAFMALARDVLISWTAHPRVAAFWLPRIERFAHWFAQTEQARRSDGGRAVGEVKGRAVIGSLDYPFTLTARADRFDVANGTLVITDYKTGQPPSKLAVLTNQAPQLPLEAAIAAQGGFGSAYALPVVGLRYIHVSGGEPAGRDCVVAQQDADELAAQTVGKLNALIARFDDPATPYAVTRRAGFGYDYDAFAHLARVGEWGLADNGADAERGAGDV